MTKDEKMHVKLLNSVAKQYGAKMFHLSRRNISAVSEYLDLMLEEKEADGDEAELNRISRLKKLVRLKPSNKEILDSLQLVLYPDDRENSEEE